MFIIPIGTATEFRESHNQYRITAAERWNSWVFKFWDADRFPVHRSTRWHFETSITFLLQVLQKEWMRFSSTSLSIIPPRMSGLKLNSSSLGTDSVWSSFPVIFKTYQHLIMIPGSLSYEWHSLFCLFFFLKEFYPSYRELIFNLILLRHNI